MIEAFVEACCLEYGGCQEVIVCRGLLSGVRWLSRGDSL